jgi:hypothetical protein
LNGYATTAALHSCRNAFHGSSWFFVCAMPVN